MENMEILTIIAFCLSILACILHTISAILSSLALIKVKALEKATHTVHFQPIESAMTDLDEQDAEGQKTWGLSDKEVAKINKINKEDYEGISL